MKKILSIIVSLLLFVTAFVAVVPPSYAQNPSISPPAVNFTPDPEVNFVGKVAARSAAFLNWTLQNYNWSCITRTATGACDNSDSPLVGFWVTIRNIVYAFFALFVLITAFIMMTTRGRSLAIQRFLPRFLFVIALVTLSYAILQLFYVTVDIIQGFFLTKSDGNLISVFDLLYVGWDYQNFQGLRQVDIYYDESVFVNLLLARITAVTYYVMTGILLIRKVILWFFIILSPVFPILLLYYPVRNTAKIWIGEFFRWLLYAPLFAIFLAGLVKLWSSARGIPLLFDFSTANNIDRIIYPTATNILLGGPAQDVNIINSLNTPDTFAEYVVALFMLWVVTILPFILLQIFLDYMNSISFSDNPAFQKIISTSNMLLNRPQPIVPLTPIPPGTGKAMSLPFSKMTTPTQIPQIEQTPLYTGAAKTIPTDTQTGLARQIPISTGTVQAQINAELLKTTNISLPTIRDIVQYETNMLSTDAAKRNTITNTYQALQRIANPASVSNQIERDRFVQIKERIEKESSTGNPIANAVLAAMQIVNSQGVSTTSSLSAFHKNITTITNPKETTTVKEKERLEIHSKLVSESQHENALATRILSMTKDTTTSEVEQIRESVVQQANAGNSLATAILATLPNFATATVSQLQTALVALAKESSSESTTSTATTLHDRLVKESKEGNSLATRILDIKESSSASEVQSLREQLVKESKEGNTLATSVLASTTTKEQDSAFREFISQIVQPGSVVSAQDKQTATAFHESLVKESQQGNELATKILSMKETSTIEEVQDMKERLIQASLQNDQTATSILSTALTHIDARTVQNSLTTLANPSVITNSAEREQVTQLKEKLVQEQSNGNAFANSVVSTSNAIYQSEVNSLQQILSQITNPEKVTDTTRREEITQLHDLVVKESKEGNSLASTVLSVTDATSTQDVERIREQILSEQHSGNPLATQFTSAIQSATETAEIQKLQEIVRQAKEQHEPLADEVNNLLTNTLNVAQKQAQTIQTNTTTLANPATITNTIEREHVTQLKEKLLQAQAQGNVFASTVVEISQSLYQTELHSLQQAIEKIVHPESITASSEKEKSSQFHDQLLKQSQEGNSMAIALLSVTQATPTKDLEQIRQQVLSEKEFGNPLAVQLATSMQSGVDVKETQKLQDAVKQAKEQKEPLAQEVEQLMNNGTKTTSQIPTSLPQSNRVQAVSFEDYEAVRNLWHDNYKTQDIPDGIMNRKEWITSDMNSISDTLNLLTSTDETKVQEGMQQVSNILPFLLLGGFSKDEIIAYLRAKKEAGKSVLSEVTTDEAEEDTKISVQRKSTTQATNAQYAQVSLSNDAETDYEAPATKFTPPAAVTNELLQLTQLSVPTMRDIVLLERSLLVNTDTAQKEIHSATEILSQISNPATIEKAEDKERVEQVRETLKQKSEQGDHMATTILSAAQSLQNTKQITSLPQNNAVQTVSLEEYEAVRKMWEENYKTLETPNGMNSKKEWIGKDIENIGNIVSLLSSTDQTQVQEGMQQVSQILPFLLLGGFSQTEIISYLKAKQEAGKSVLVTLENDEETQVSVERTNTEASASLQQHQEIQSNTSESSAFNTQEMVSTTTQTNGQTLTQLQNLPVPTMRDISNYEIALRSQNSQAREELSKVEEVLKTIAVPQSNENTTSEVTTLREQLLNEKDKGDVRATQILQAAEHYSQPQNEITEADVTTFKTSLSEITQPTDASIHTQTTDRNDIATLKTLLVTESEKGNEMATHLLSLNQETAQMDIEKIREQLAYGVKQQEAIPTATVGTLLQNTQGQTIVPLVQAIIDPLTQVSVPFDKETRHVLHETLVSESNQGSEFAKELLSVTNETNTQTLVDHVTRESEQGNILASQLLVTALSTIDTKELQTELIQIATFDNTTISQSSSHTASLHSLLVDESNKGNTLATHVLNMNTNTSLTEFKSLMQEIIKEQALGNPVAERLAAVLPEANKKGSTKVAKTFMLPQSNTLQTVSIEDYEAVRKLWEEYYEHADVPQPFATRLEWLQSEISIMDGLLPLLTSERTEEVEKGLAQVSAILPFLLLGGFSLSEVVSYLKAKREAAKSVLQKIEKEEDTTELVGSATHSTGNQQEMTTTYDSSDSESTANGTMQMSQKDE